MKVLENSGFAERPIPTLQKAVFLSDPHMEKNRETKFSLMSLKRALIPFHGGGSILIT